MELPEQGGIEPDYCFYIPHWQVVVGRDRLDWEHDPPPDLVLEVDVTNYTNVDDYCLYQVPEVDSFEQSDGSSITVVGSANFPTSLLPPSDRSWSS